jgi:carboxymethylenebutenolidase
LNDDARQAAIALYDRFTHQGMDRRLFMAELTRIAGSTAAAAALLGGIAADPAAAAIVPENDPRLQTRTIEWELIPGRKMRGYGAAPAETRPGLPMVIVVHENRGLNGHIRDVARRLALEGPSRRGAGLPEPDRWHARGREPGTRDDRQARSRCRRGGRPCLHRLAELRRRRVAQSGRDRASAGAAAWSIGLRWRQGPTSRLRCPSTGRPPRPAEASKVLAPMLIHLAEKDERVNATALPGQMR